VLKNFPIGALLAGVVTGAAHAAEPTYVPFQPSATKGALYRPDGAASHIAFLTIIARRIS
jgi:hypothetical protein